MVRNLAKTIISSGAHWLGIDTLAGARNGTGRLPLIVCYHRVVENFEASVTRSLAPMLISRENFEKQLDWIAGRYDIVSLDTLTEQMARKPEDCGGLAAITFDDGYEDIYNNAWPVLRERNIPATVFVVSEVTGTLRLQTHDELYLLISGALEKWRSPGDKLVDLMSAVGISADRERLKRYTGNPFHLTRFIFTLFGSREIEIILELLRERIAVDRELLAEFRSLTWDMLREMESENITIGSHTRSHPILPNESRERVREEVAGSRLDFERQLQKPVRHFAYPNGSFDRTTVEAVADAGYEFAYTTCKHTDPQFPLLTIPRRVFWEKSSTDFLGRCSPAMMSSQVNGIFDPADLCGEDHFAERC